MKLKWVVSDIDEFESGRKVYTLIGGSLKEGEYVEVDVTPEITYEIYVKTHCHNTEITKLSEHNKMSIIYVIVINNLDILAKKVKTT